MSELENKLALITGGATGFGKAIAEVFSQNGSRVIIIDISKEEGEMLAKDLGGSYYYADLTNQIETEKICDEVLDQHGNIDILVNNAGYQKINRIEDFQINAWNSMLQLMLTTPFQLTRRFLPGMKESMWGRIINMSSIHGLVASPYKSAYISAKHGLIGLTKTTAVEVGQFGITCNAICPAYVRTGLTERQISDQSKLLGIEESEFVEQVALDSAAIKVLIEPEEVANLAMFLSSEKSSKITGGSYTIDLGWTAR